jgi:hypothetical protein
MSFFAYTSLGYRQAGVKVQSVAHEPVIITASITYMTFDEVSMPNYLLVWRLQDTCMYLYMYM